MLIKSNNIKLKLRKIVTISIFSLCVFFALFYVINFIDLNPAKKNIPIKESTQVPEQNNSEIKKRINNVDIGLATFGSWAKVNNVGDDYDKDADGDRLANYLEYIYGTDPNNSDSDGDGFSDSREIANGYDPDSKGETMTIVSVNIEKLGIDVPMVWSKTDDEDKMLADLEKGVGHYNKSAAPGQKGNMIIFGHSSNYIWAKGNYNHIFKDLNNLEQGDKILIKTAQKNGRIINYQYEINDKFVTVPNDKRIFTDTSTPTLTLSTCWPLGTTLRRMIIKAELLQ